ncbi:MAG TPA: FAD-dependent thymidylate synthase [Candidatus Paceibacterota bacterium]|nr:FAD-dependent thymidylate synthase [Candidatus Paceibacterota bacterium]
MKVFLYDEFNPQDIAMMQALYSRSPESVTKHVEKVRQTGSGKFMERFYVGYGHASIADCGSTTLFIEGVSMLAAKAIEDWPLFSGQESSSRYIDYSKQTLGDPIGTLASKKILDSWMAFYIASLPKVEEHLMAKYPRKDGEDEGVYKKAIKARAFDIMRGFLPAGVHTQLSWHTNLRQAGDKLFLLKHHPLKEVRDLAEKIHAELFAKYPHSFGHKFSDEQENYRKYLQSKYNYFFNADVPEFKMKTNIKTSELNKYKDIFAKRPEKTGLPNFLAELGNVTYDFLLDFGSFRDIQRHRNGVCRMPLLTTKLGFNEWYLAELPEAVRKEANGLIKEQKKAIVALKTDKETAQYYTAMGFNVSCRVTYGLPAAVYVMELRSGRPVHPTLRKVAHKMHAALKKAFPLMKTHPDLALTDWDVKRGLQDIRERK